MKFRRPLAASAVAAATAVGGIFLSSLTALAADQPPLACTWRASVVLPDDSGPNISIILPRG